MQNPNIRALKQKSSLRSMCQCELIAQNKVGAPGGEVIERVNFCIPFFRRRPEGTNYCIISALCKPPSPTHTFPYSNPLTPPPHSHTQTHSLPHPQSPTHPQTWSHRTSTLSRSPMIRGLHDSRQLAQVNPRPIHPHTWSHVMSALSCSPKISGLGTMGYELMCAQYSFTVVQSGVTYTPLGENLRVFACAHV